MTWTIPFFFLLQASVGDPNRFSNFLTLGYALMWLVGAVYVISLLTRQANVQQDLRLLKRLLEEDEADEGE